MITPKYKKSLNAITNFINRLFRSHDPETLTISHYHHVLNQLSDGEQIKTLMLEIEMNGLQLDTAVFNILIKKLCNQGKINEALQVKEQMKVSYLCGIIYN